MRPPADDGSLNSGFAYRERLNAAAGGRLLPDWLAERHAHSSAAVWRERASAGEIEIDGRLAGPDERLAAGGVLVWRRPPWCEPAVPLAFAILHRDPQLLAVAKPRGLPTLPNGGFLEHTLQHLVRRAHPEASAAHRLGRGTSGLVLFARTPEARRRLAAAWRQGRVEKEYLALVQGVPASALSIDAPIGRVPHPRLGLVHAASRDGRPSLSHVRLLQARDGRALCAVRIPTGRPHQIRIHLAVAGHPLVGDPLYVAGGVPGPDPGLPGDLGYHLHAWRLRLAHPASGRTLEIECTPPSELRL
ncbi:MAG: RluA family pseudouridine synthase [Vicinamibacteria bacterium]